MSTSTSQDLRCPRCAAHVRAGSDWCTLCYTDLRPAPPAPEPAEPEPSAPGRTALQPPGSEPLAGETAEAAAVSRGKHARRPSAEQEADVARTAEALLEQLAAAESGHPLGRLAGHVDSPGRKVALMAGGAVALMAVLFLLMVVIGAVL